MYGIRVLTRFKIQADKRKLALGKELENYLCNFIFYFLLMRVDFEDVVCQLLKVWEYVLDKFEVAHRVL